MVNSAPWWIIITMTRSEYTEALRQYVPPLPKYDTHINMSGEFILRSLHTCHVIHWGAHWLALRKRWPHCTAIMQWMGSALHTKIHGIFRRCYIETYVMKPGHFHKSLQRPWFLPIFRLFGRQKQHFGPILRQQKKGTREGKRATPKFREAR